MNKLSRPYSLLLRGVSKKVFPATAILCCSLSTIMPYRRGGNLALARPRQSIFDDFESIFPLLDTSPFLSGLLKAPLPMDFYETKEKYHIECDVPGFKKSEVKLECDDDFLIIQAERAESSPKTEDDTTYHVAERTKSQRQVYRKIRLPRDANMEEVDAKFNHGVLSITLPKFEHMAKTIEVSTSDE